MNTPARLGALRAGDRVRFDGAVHTVAAFTGTTVRLAAETGSVTVVLLAHLLAAPGFELLDAGPPRRMPPFGLLDGLPEVVVARARWWERHIVEVETGLPPGSPADAQPSVDYDPGIHTLANREAAKVAELAAAGEPVGLSSLRRMRRRYREQGLWGLVDRRATRQATPFGNADPRLVAAINKLLEQETNQSTGTRGRLRQRVEQALAAEHGPGVLALPSTATFYRLVNALAAGRHTFGSAPTRRSVANRPGKPFTPTVACRPGEQVQLDSTQQTSLRSTTTGWLAGWT